MKFFKKSKNKNKTKQKNKQTNKQKTLQSYSTKKWWTIFDKACLEDVLELKQLFD